MRMRSIRTVGMLAVAAVLTAVTLAGGLNRPAQAGLAPAALPPRPNFQLPFPCGQRWVLFSYPQHDPADRKIDMQRLDGTTGGSPVVAALGGVVHELPDPGGIEIDHGGGWFTLYLHMSVRSVQIGQRVSQGEQIGVVGHVGTTVDHLHYELLYDANGDHDGTSDEIVVASFNGVEYYMGANGENRYDVTSNNCGNTSVELTRLADVDGDGRADLVSFMGPGNDLWVYRNRGYGQAEVFAGYDAKRVAVGFDPARTQLADVDGDGRADLVTFMGSSNELWVYHNRGYGQAEVFSDADTKRVVVGFDPARTRLADVDGDGRADLASFTGPSNDLWVYHNRGYGQAEVFAGYDARSVAVGFQP